MYFKASKNYNCIRVMSLFSQNNGIFANTVPHFHSELFLASLMNSFVKPAQKRGRLAGSKHAENTRERIQNSLSHIAT